MLLSSRMVSNYGHMQDSTDVIMQDNASHQCSVNISGLSSRVASTFGVHIDDIKCT